MHRTHNKLLNSALSSAHFFHVKNGFLRLNGEVLQGVFFYSRPSTLLQNRKRVLVIALHSIYEPDIIMQNKKLSGMLAGPRSVYEYRGFRESIQPIRQFRGEPTIGSELEQIEILREDCLPVLNSVNNPRTLYKIMIWSDIVRSGQISYVDTAKIYPLIRLHQYDEAIKYCDSIIQQHLAGEESSEKILSPEQIVIRRQKIEAGIAFFRNIRTMLIARDAKGLDELLDLNKGKNLALYDRLKNSKLSYL